MTTRKSVSHLHRPCAAALATMSALGAMLVLGCRPIPPAQDAISATDRADVGLPVLEMRWKRALADRMRESKPQEFATGETLGDQLFIGSAQGAFHALSVRSGAVLWTSALAGITSTPVVDTRGRIFVGTADGILACLRASDGSEIWRYETRGAINEPPVIVDRRLIFSNEDDHVYALDADTGEFLWQYKGDTPEEYTLRGHAGLAAGEDLVFTGFSNGTAVALRQETGSVAWLTSLKSDDDRFIDVDGTPVLGDDGRVFVTSSSSGVYALDVETGLVAWQLRMQGASDLLIDEDRLYVTAAEQGIYALNLQGDVIWRQGSRGGGEPSMPVVSGEYVLYALSEDGLFVADKRTGVVHQYFEPGDGISAAPLVRGDEVFVLSNRGILYAMYLNRF